MKYGKLDNCIRDYLLWMIDKNRSLRTVESHEGMLKYFKAFAVENGLSFEKAVQPETANAFLAECKLAKAPPAINGFMRYLESKQLATGFTKAPRPMGTVFECYMDYFQRTRRVQPARVKHIRRILTNFNAFLDENGLSPDQIEIGHVDTFLENINKDYSPRTRRDNRSVVRGLLNYLYRERGILKRDLGAMLVSAPDFARDNPPKYYRPAEIRRLFACMRHDSPGDLRSNAVVWLAYATGLRPVEIVRITLDDIVFTRAELTLAVRKGDNPVVFPLPDETVKAISAYILGARPESKERVLFLGLDPPFAPISRYAVRRIAGSAIQKAGLEGTPYWLRHTYAQNLLESGASIFEIKEMLGHDDIKSTKRYLHIHVRLMREVLFNEFEDKVQ